MITDDMETQLVREVWQNLKSTCAADPPRAKRLVTVGENDVAAAISTALRTLGIQKEGAD